MLCFEVFKYPNLVFKQFIQRLKADGITVKTDKAFPAKPYEVVRVFNQVRDEAFNNQQAIKEAVGVKNREQSYGLTEEMNVVLKKPDLNLRQRALTANVSYLATQEYIGKFTVQDGIAEDTETGLVWLRFAHGQIWQNGTAIDDAKKVNLNKAFEIAKQFNQQGGYAGYNDWRLPNIDELKTLIDKVKGKSGNYVDTDVFPNNTQRFWSSSPLAGNTGGAWIVNFSNGNGGYGDGKSYNYVVRLVRGNTIDKPSR